MTDDDPTDDRTDRRREPIGTPVVRGDPEITGAHADEAARFDPDDPASLDDAVETVREFADDAGDVNHLDMLQGAAACAALVRGLGSYKAAAERADVDVRFLQKWARVHDLPISIRRLIARGEIAPTAAKQIASLTGDARFLLAWAVVDHDLTVAEVRSVSSAVADGSGVAAALAHKGVDLGRIEVTLPPDLYRELRREASLSNQPVDSLLASILRAGLDRRS